MEVDKLNVTSSGVPKICIFRPDRGQKFNFKYMKLQILEIMVFFKSLFIGRNSK